MRAISNQNLKTLFLLSFCVLFFLKCFTSFSYAKIDSNYILIESTEESESESHEKLAEAKVEYEDFSNHSIFILFVDLNENINFLHYDFHLSLSCIENVELPPEC